MKKYLNRIFIMNYNPLKINNYQLDKKKIKKLRFISILIFLLIFFFFFMKVINQKAIFLNNDFNNSADIKVCLCTLGKKENLYIKEFIQYYEKIGIDRIFLYDNNDINGERFEDIIEEYINKSFVKLFNWRGKSKILIPYLNDCYKRNYKHFDWLLFYEIDEYIHIKNYINIKQFLNNPHFKKCQTINLNWVLHTDNNQIYYDNRSLHERFPEVQNISEDGDKTRFNYVKSIMKGNIPNIYIYNTHFLSQKLKSCNGFGKKHQLVGQNLKKNDFEYYYIDHYYSKSLEEYVSKINRGCPHFDQSIEYKKSRLIIFFSINKVTIEKINYIEKNVGINLTYIRNIYNISLK